MGLSVVTGIVTSHDGALRVRSTPGEGTCFQIYLPAHTAPEQIQVTPKPQSPKGSERVLYVDDEPSIMRLGRQLLTKLGYTVTTCDNAQAALALFNKNPAGFDLVITDMTMPKITGIELAQTLLKERPDLPIILCSGNKNQLSAVPIKALGIREVLTKPILKEEMAVAIRRTLEPN